MRFSYLLRVKGLLTKFWKNREQSLKIRIFHICLTIWKVNYEKNIIPIFLEDLIESYTPTQCKPLVNETETKDSHVTRVNSQSVDQVSDEPHNDSETGDESKPETYVVIELTSEGDVAPAQEVEVSPTTKAEVSPTTKAEVSTTEAIVEVAPTTKAIPSEIEVATTLESLQSQCHNNLQEGFRIKIGLHR